MRFDTTDAPTYQVRLPVFEGPLDLLLHLIERQELDITRVALAQVTDQYLAYLAVLEEVRPSELADFLVVAAKLLLIKSRALLPPPPAALGLDEEEEDPGEALARQLREYKRFKEVAQLLKEREAQGLRSFVRLAPPPRLERELDLGDVTLADLLTALQQALQATPPASPVAEVVPPLSITIGEKIALVEKRLQTSPRLSFSNLLREARSRLEVIVTFLAVLEMIKAGRISAHQEQLFGEIYIVRA